MIYCVLIFSFLLEGAFTNLVSRDSLFIPLFFLMSLSILYPYFNNKKFNFIVCCLACGLIYDIVFSDSVFINTLNFSVVGCLIIFIYTYINYNMFSMSIINLIVIIIYRTISYMLLFMFSFVSFDGDSLMNGISNSIISNIIYGIILFMVISFIAKVFKIKKSD